jgi:site-specific DNA-adenine methylase
VNKKGEYNVAYDGINKRNLSELISNIDVYSKQLKDTIIINNDFRNVLEDVKNNKEDFVFLDPPYLDCKTMYTKSQDFLWIYEYIKQYMTTCKCKVMLITKTDENLSRMFSDFNNNTYDFSYSANNKYNKKVKHMLITNY